MGDINKDITDMMDKMVLKYLKDVQNGLEKFDLSKYQSMNASWKARSRQGDYKNLNEMYEGEDENRGAMVKENIRERARLRDRPKKQFPNIANIMSGGAPGVIGQLGGLQSAAAKPFQSVYDYKKAQASSAEFKAEIDEKRAADPSYKMSKDEKRRSKTLSGEEEEAKKKAGGGLGKNLMGKRMQGMIGKVGKFMDSSKGQGMMAGGMMGASILTMIIKKAMEASPMLQQMLKIMNVAMTLFLRPIGDFIGGMLKPIMLFFLREIAVPMLQKGKDFIKFGEAFGKNILGFLLKPIETIVTAITLAMNPFLTATERVMHENFDGVKEWMSEKKMNMIATDVLGEGATRQDLEKLLVLAGNQEVLGLGNNDRSGSTRYGEGPSGDQKGWDAETWAKIEAEFGTGADLTGMGEGAKSPLDTFRQLMTDVNENTYTFVKASEELNKAASGVALGMGGVATEFDSITLASGRVVDALDYMAEKMGGKDPEIVVGGDVVVTPTGGGDVVVEEPEGTTAPTGPKSWREMTGSVGAMAAAAGQQIREGLKSASTISKETYVDEAGNELERTIVTTSEAYKQAIIDYQELTAGGNRTVLEGVQAKFKTMGETSHVAMINTGLMETNTDTMLISTKDMVNNFLKGGDLTESMVTKLAAMIAKMNVSAKRRMGFTGNNPNWSDMTNEEKGNYATNQLKVHLEQAKQGNYPQNFKMDASGRRRIPLQHGGMINEPIWGIGASGTEYTLGESGPEMVTPMNKVGAGGIGPVTINVNVDKINSDVDLEKIKPVIERALHEIHARRGII